MSTIMEVEIHIELGWSGRLTGEEWELVVEETDYIGPEIKRSTVTYPPS